MASEEATDEESGYNWADRFPHAGDGHVAFGETPGTEEVRLTALLARLAVSPRAFAILYDAERARFAYCLERLTKDVHEPPGNGRDTRDDARFLLEDSFTFVASLMTAHGHYARRGDIPDPRAYDRTVLRHARASTAPGRTRCTAPSPWAPSPSAARTPARPATAREQRRS